MKELPDDDRLKIMAQVAVTSAIEGQGDVYKNFFAAIISVLGRHTTLLHTLR
jgi:hypothetical protein